MGKWPSLAYYWPTDTVISASDAIMKRERDNRTGVIWCHAECYKANPQNGNSLFARRGPGSPHFWIGPGNFTMYVGCDFEIFKNRNSESYRYSQVLHDLYEWLNSNEENQELGIVSVIKTPNEIGSDISLNHMIIGEIPRERTNILIRDRNRKRTGNSSNTLTIDISRWPDSHVQDFENHAKRLLFEEWDRLNQQKKVIQRTPKLDQHVTKRTEISAWPKRGKDLVAEQLSVSTETVQRLDALRSLLSDITKAYRRDSVKKIREEAKIRYGEKLSSKSLRDRFISNATTKRNDIDDLSKILANASDTIQSNHDRSNPRWLKNWDKLLMSITPEDYTLKENGDYQKIMSKYQSHGRVDFEQDIEMLHRLLILKNTPFFEHVAPTRGGKGYVTFRRLRTVRTVFCLYRFNDQEIYRGGRRVQNMGYAQSLDDVSITFAYEKDDCFFKEVFKDL